MKLEMELRPKDIVLLKVLGCVLIAFVMIRFLIFPGIEKHMDLSEQKAEVVSQQEDMQALIDRKDSLDAIIANQQAALKGAQEGYYGLLENREVDELITGIILNHNLFPVYLNITDATGGVPVPYFLAAQAPADTTALADTSGSTDSSSDTGNSSDSSDSSENTDSSSDGSSDTQTIVSYVHTTSVDVSIQGGEADIRAFLDDIANNYPGIQVTSFNMQESSYVNGSMQTISQMSSSCTLAVYTCGEQ